MQLSIPMTTLIKNSHHHKESKYARLSKLNFIVIRYSHSLKLRCYTRRIIKKRHFSTFPIVVIDRKKIGAFDSDAISSK
jgi:glutaredoxin